MVSSRPTTLNRATNVRFGSKADICGATRHVRFTPNSDIKRDTMECPLRAKSGHRHIHTVRLYGFMANAQKPLFASSTNRAFANPALTSVFVRPSLDWPE